MTPGDRLGTLTLVEIAEKDPYGHYRWRVRCDCGFEMVRSDSYLKQQSRPTCSICTNEKRKVARQKRWRRQWRDEGTLWTDTETEALVGDVLMDLEGEHGPSEWVPSLRFGSIEVAAGFFENTPSFPAFLESGIDRDGRKRKRIEARSRRIAFADLPDDYGCVDEDEDAGQASPSPEAWRSGCVTIDGADLKWHEEWERNSGPSTLMRCPRCAVRMRLQARRATVDGVYACPLCRTTSTVSSVDGWRATLQAGG